jgi:hypothetical protein
MNQIERQQLIETFSRRRRSSDKRWITSDEFTHGALQEFSELDHVCTDVIPVLWDLIPEIAKSVFIARIRQPMLPGFSWRPLWIGPGRSAMKEDEIQHDDDIRRGRIRTWATEFIRFWDTMEQTGNE